MSCGMIRRRVHNRGEQVYRRPFPTAIKYGRHQDRRGLSADKYFPNLDEDSNGNWFMRASL